MPELDKHIAAAIIPAAGSGSRMGVAQPKQFMTLGGPPVLALTISRFLETAEILSIVVPVGEDQQPAAERILQRFFTGEQRRRIQLVSGGATRQQSVRAGLEAIPPATEAVLVHDGARPFVTPSIIQRCLIETLKTGAAIAAIQVRDTIKQEGPDGTINRTIDRSLLWQAQTPQGVGTDLLRRAYAVADEDGFLGTDEASLLEHAGIPVAIVEGSELNFKITRPDDLVLAAGMNEAGMKMRIGHGFDAHKFTIGRQLILGGTRIPFDLGLEGHSDADTVVHALIDALLGAMGEGDIGRRFPDNDAKYKGISSLKLLEEVMQLATGKNMVVANADLTIICQYPKLAPHVDAMRQNIAAVCNVKPEAVNIKATTTEMMGFTGRREGIAAHAVVLMEGNPEPAAK